MTNKTLDQLIAENKSMREGRAYDAGLKYAISQYELKNPEAKELWETAQQYSKPAQPKTWLQEFGEGLKGSAGSFAEAGVNQVRTFLNHMERQITFRMSDPKSSLASNIAQFAERTRQRAFEGAKAVQGGAKKSSEVYSATADILTDLANQFIGYDIKRGQPLSQNLEAISKNVILENPFLGSMGKDYFRGMMSMGDTFSQNILNPIEKKINEWAGVKDLGMTGKIFAGAIGSLPYSAMTRGGVAAMPVMLTNLFQNNMEQLVAEGKDPTAKMTVINAMTTAAIEMGSEYIFSLWGGAFGGVKALSKGAGKNLSKQGILLGTKGLIDLFKRELPKAVKPTIGNFIKYVVRQGAEEGFEEVVSYLGSIFVALATTDNDKKFNELFSWEELKIAGLSGALMGSVISSTQINGWSKQKQMAEMFYDKDIKDITKEDYQKFVDIIRSGATDPELQKIVAENLAAATAKAQQEREANGTAETVAGEAAKPVTGKETKSTVENELGYFPVEGNELQQRNLGVINDKLSSVYKQYEQARENRDMTSIRLTKQAIEILRREADMVKKYDDYNPYNFKVKAPVAPVAEAPATAPEAPVTTEGEPVTAQPTEGAVEAPRGTQPVSYGKKREDFPTYLGWLQHQRDALVGRANKTTKPNERTAILGKRIPEIDAKIAAEKEAVAKGQTTEPAPKVKAQPKEKKPKSEKPKAEKPPVTVAEPTTEPVAEAPQAQEPVTTEEKKPAEQKSKKNKNIKGNEKKIEAYFNFQKNKGFNERLANDSEIPDDLLTMADWFEKNFNIPHVFFVADIKTENGKAMTLGGSFYDGIIFVNTTGFDRKQGMTVETMSHEMIHYLDNQKLLQSYKDVLFVETGITNEIKALTDKGMSLSDAKKQVFKKWMAEVNAPLGAYSESQYEEEVVARLSQKFFTDIKFWDKLYKKFGQKSDGLFQKLRRWLSGLVNISKETKDNSLEKSASALIDTLDAVRKANMEKQGIKPTEAKQTTKKINVDKKYSSWSDAAKIPEMPQMTKEQAEAELETYLSTLESKLADEMKGTDRGYAFLSPIENFDPSVSLLKNSTYKFGVLKGKKVLLTPAEMATIERLSELAGEPIEQTPYREEPVATPKKEEKKPTTTAVVAKEMTAFQKMAFVAKPIIDGKKNYSEYDTNTLKNSKQDRAALLVLATRIFNAYMTSNKQPTEIMIDVDKGVVKPVNDTMIRPIIDGAVLQMTKMNSLLSFYRDVNLGKLADAILYMANLPSRITDIDTEAYNSIPDANKTFTVEQINTMKKAQENNGMSNLYFTIGEAGGIENIDGTIRLDRTIYGVNVAFFFSPTQLTSKQIKDNGLGVVYTYTEEAPKPVRAKTKPEPATPEQTRPVVQASEKTFETKRFEDAKITATYDTDKKKVILTIDSYVDPERADALQRHGFKRNTHNGTYSKSFIEGKTYDELLGGIVKDLAKIEERSAVDISQSPQNDIERMEYAEAFNNISYTTGVDHESEQTVGGNAEAMERIRGARKFKNQKESRNWTKDIATWFKEVFTRGALPYLERAKYGELRLLFLQSISEKSIAASLAEQQISMYNNVDAKHYWLASEYIALADMVDDIRAGRLTEDKLPWGFKNKNEVFAEFQRRQTLVNHPEYVDVKDLIQIREDSLELIRELYKKYAADLGYDASVIFTHKAYMHHAVQDFKEAIKIIKASSAGKQKSWIFEQRLNADVAYVTDPALADFVTIQQLFSDIGRMKLLIEVKRYDVAHEYARGEEIPEGYVQVESDLFGVKYPEDQIKAKMKLLGTQMADTLGLYGKTRAEFLRITEEKQMETRLVIPEEIARTAKALFDPKDRTKVGLAWRKAIKAWKAVMIKWPHRFLNYNIRNFVGDLDAMLAAYPKAITYIAPAFKELRDFYQNKSTSLNLMKYISMGGMSTGLSDVELGKFQEQRSLSFYEGIFKQEDVGTMKKMLLELSRAKTSYEGLLQFREQLLRYATFTYLMDNELNNDTALPRYYGASYAPEIQSIRTKEGRAFKLSNDALGAYNDVSTFASAISDTAIPFFRFKWINVSRYFMLLRNTMVSDNVAMAQAGLSFAKRLGIAGKVTASGLLRLGRLFATGSIITLAQALANMRDDEEDLPDYIKNQIHLYLFALNGRSYYFTGLGSISDLANFFGIDTAIADYHDLTTGRITMKEYLSNIVLAPIDNFANELFPIIKPVQELLRGEKSFPETSKIRDKGEYLANAFGFRDLYRMASNLPDKQLNPLQHVLSVFGSSAETEYSVYWQARDLVNAYNQQKGKGEFTPQANTSDKGNSIYYFKEAIRLGDKKAAQHYILAYIANGGTYQSYMQSMKTMHPLQNLKASDRADFLESLTPQEKEKVDRAIALYDKIITEGEAVAVGAFSTGSTSRSMPSPEDMTLEDILENIGE